MPESFWWNKNTRRYVCREYVPGWVATKRAQYVWSTKYTANLLTAIDFIIDTNGLQCLTCNKKVHANHTTLFTLEPAGGKHKDPLPNPTADHEVRLTFDARNQLAILRNNLAWFKGDLYPVLDKINSIL
jgi:uncharacterized protein YchJ